MPRFDNIRYEHFCIVGYGNPGAARYSEMPNQIYSMDWNDTFLNADHLRASFPNHRVQIELKTPTMKAEPPFRLEFEKPEKDPKGKEEVEKMEVCRHDMVPT